MTVTAQPILVSIHGGHSGDFCHHAKDGLEDIIKAYVRQGFQWVGLTEHMPPPSDRFLYPDEMQAGYSAKKRLQQFDDYMTTARRLQAQYAKYLTIAVGFETEMYDGALHWIAQLIRRYQPDYIVGSVHHVKGFCFDYSVQFYQRAISAAGSLEALYGDFFDQQYQMIQVLRPRVIGHFDLIRLFDPAYCHRIQHPSISARIERNLQAIKQIGAIMDCNARALIKGADEPYPTRPILRRAIELGIPVAPGDDSHSVDSVGRHVAETINILAKLGLEQFWTLP